MGPARKRRKDESLHGEPAWRLTLTLAAQLAEAEKNQAERDRLLVEAGRVMASVSALGEWEIGCLKTAAQMSGDAELGKVSFLCCLNNPIVPSLLPSHPMYPSSSLRPDTSQRLRDSRLQAAFERGVVDNSDTV